MNDYERFIEALQQFIAYHAIGAIILLCLWATSTRENKDE